MRAVWLLVIPVTSVIVACSLLTNLGDLASGSDASTSDVAVPTDGFTIGLSPKHVVLDPGEKDVPVTITIVRAPAFTDGVTFKIQSDLSKIKFGTPVDIGTGNTTTFGVSLEPLTPSDGVDHELAVTGTSLDGKHSAGPVKLGVWIGSQLTPNDAGVITVPPFASQVDITAWGAGGGGGVYLDNQAIGTNGGAGGYARAIFPIAPGSKLAVSIGTPGMAGGGGGGWSGVSDEDGGVWLLAGGGGGGCSYNLNTGGGAGGAGGGATGAAGLGCGGGGGGSQVDGGAPGNCRGVIGKAGSAFTGGNASSSYPPTDGKPGGGAGGGGCCPGPGGGGGGYHGGGSGAFQSQAGCGGGGGGSSYVRDGGADAKSSSGSGAVPNTQDPSYKAPIAVGGNGGTSTTQGVTNGGPGEVIVRVPKP